MKNIMICFLALMGFTNPTLASGCFNESFYNTKAVAESVGADACYFEPLAKIQDPQSMADRQYNYFSEKMNEYAMVFNPEALDKAFFEFMFYPNIRKNALTNEDARKVHFDYEQTFKCSRQGESQKVSVQIFAFGYVGLTGVCLSKKDVSW